MASEQFSSGPGLHSITHVTSSSRLIPNPIPEQPCIPPPREDGRQTHTLFKNLGKWTKDHLIENVIGDPSLSVSIRKQFQTDAMWCYFDAFLTSVEQKNFKQAMTEPSWIVMQCKKKFMNLKGYKFGNWCR
ncbi:hypothetical protein Tco_0346226, partial [Tanacetum coccineum]